MVSALFQYYPGPRLSGLCPVSVLPWPKTVVLPWPKTQWSLPCFSITLALDSVVSALFQYYPGPRLSFSITLALDSVVSALFQYYPGPILSGLCPVSVLPWP